MYKLIIFDCDGTLVDSESLANRVFAQGLQELGCNLSPEECSKKFAGTTWDFVKKELHQEYGLQISNDFFEQKIQKTMKAFPTQLRPLLHDVLQTLHTHNIARCVASNSSLPWIIRALDSTDQLQFFNEEHIFCIDHVEQGKPAPDIFLHAAAQMNCKPHECLVIEDSVAGITAAKAAQMHVIGFTGASHAKDEHYQERLKACQVPIASSAKEILKHVGIHK